MWSFRQWRRRRVVRRHRLSDEQWTQARARLPILAGLTYEEERTLRELAVVFLHEKSLEQAQGLEMTESMRLLVALQACLPILHLGLDWYDGWVSVVVYPGAFVPVRQWIDDAGVQHTSRQPLTGESWQRGPVVLSWPDVEEGGVLDGHNLVIHEFAHKLDSLDGSANGHPPLHPGMNSQTWARALGDAFNDTRTHVERGARTVLDPYAAENPAEFFAVISEVFLETPHRLKQAYPAVYEQLKLFYRQDPALRLAT